MKTRVSKKGKYKIHTLEGRIKSMDIKEEGGVDFTIKTREGNVEELKIPFKVPEEVYGHRIFYIQNDSIRTEERNTGKLIYDNDGPEQVYEHRTIERKEYQIIILDGLLEGIIYREVIEECIHKSEY